MKTASGGTRTAASLVILLWLGGSSIPALIAQTAKPDNTTINKRDRDPREQTADKQPNNRTDVDTTREIRRAIVADKSLSTYAHNIKIITQNGKVTLKGPVRTAAEKAAIESKAAEVAGPANVINEVSIVSTKAKAQKPS